MRLKDAQPGRELPRLPWLSPIEALRILQREPRGARGLQIVAKSDGVLGPASIYIVLADLEEQGLVRVDDALILAHTALE